MAWCHAGYSRDDAAAWIAASEPVWRERHEYSFAIEDDQGALLGGCGLNRIEPFSGTANLGYWVRTSATGRGIATAAVLELCQFAFSVTDLYRLEIIAAVNNLASQRVAEKAGAIREGILRQRSLVAGGRQNSIIYSVLKPDFERRR
jgi:RimJ/RimL family protein N-acetyltransferase